MKFLQSRNASRSRFPSLPALCCSLLIGCAFPGNARAQGCDTVNTACPIGSLTTTVTRSGQVSPSSPVDFYQFIVPNGPVLEVTARIPSSSLSDAVELALARDENHDGIEDVLVSDTGRGPTFANDAVVTLWLDPGTYFVRVSQGGAASTTDYTLILSQISHPLSPGNGDNNRFTARALNVGAPVTDFVGTNDIVDYYSFVVSNQVTAVTGRVAAASLSASVTLSLLRDDDVLVSDSGRGPTLADDAVVTLWLDPGTYYLRVAAGSVSDNTTYTLELFESARPTSPGTNDNSLASARLFNPGQPITDFVGTNDDVDFYTFDIPGQSTAVTALVPASSLSAMIQLCLLDNNGSVIACDTGRGPTLAHDAYISQSLAPGTYYVRVASQSLSDHTTYVLGISGPPPPPMPAIELSGDLSFGSLQAGSTAMRTLTISNTGGATLNVSGIAYPSGFSGAFSGAIPVSGSTNVAVTFAPSGVGSYSGFVTVNSDAASGAGTIPISGSGAPVPTRVLGLSGNLAFGDVESGRSATRVLVVQNSGNTPLTIGSIQFPDRFSGGFSGVIQPGATQNVTVTFAPDAATAFGGTVTVSSDATSGVDSISASGNGTPARTRVIALSGNLSFGSVEVARNAARVLVITNSGDASFVVSNISYPEGFSGNFAGTVASHGFRTVTVSFSPAEVRAYEGTVTVNSDAGAGTNTAAISGEGSPALTRVIGLIGDLSFGNLPARSSAGRQLTITNAGEASFTVSNIVFPPAFSGAFTGPVPAHDSRKLIVTFAPELAQAYDGLVTVVSDANGGANTIEASGAGTPAALLARSGNYYGLFYQLEAVRHESSGFFTFTTPTPGKKPGSYSAKIWLAGRQYSVIGRLSFDGSATNVIRRVGKDTVTVVWQADPDGGDLITGTMGAASWDAVLSGARNVYAPKTNNAPQAGRYTMAFAGLPGSMDSPEGDGIAALTISDRGLVSFSGTLADGSKVTQASGISAGGQWPFYASLYGGRGSMLGWLQFSNDLSSDLGGRMSWIRPPLVLHSKLYPNGFEVDSDTAGSCYTPPIGKTNRVVAITNGIVTLTGGNLPDPLVNSVILGRNNKVTNNGPYKLTMTVSTANGLWSGTLTPNGPKSAIALHGVILQRTNSMGYGTGYFLQTNVSGRVTFEPAAP